MRADGPDGYWVSDDPSLLNIERVQHWLSTEAYWALGRPPEVTAAAIKNSLNLGLYTAGGDQAGYARLVSDYATFAWLCDVFVDETHRGAGIGSFLIGQSVNHPSIRGCRQFLATALDRTIYERYGYIDLPGTRRWMERPGS
jgi:GNAT superfamily N-acetyltransferase